MELLTTSILTLLALYVIYSEPFKLPTIIKKNKKLSYILIIGLYLYYHQNNVEDFTTRGGTKVPFGVFIFFCTALLFPAGLIYLVVAAISAVLGAGNSLAEGIGKFVGGCAWVAGVVGLYLSR